MLATAIQNSLEYMLGFLDRFVAGIPTEKLVSQGSGAANHPLWTLGHLAFSFQMIGGEMELAPWLQQDSKTLFGPGSAPVADAERYPSTAVLFEALKEGRNRLVQRMESLGPTGLAAPMPDERFRPVFP